MELAFPSNESNTMKGVKHQENTFVAELASLLKTQPKPNRDMD